jgi:HK97 family phage prohead protease
MTVINVITGAPCSGKSTYVKSKADEGDVVIDYDLLATAFGSKTPYAASGSIRKVALNAREDAINTVLKGVESTAWVIHTNPRKDWLDSYTEKGANIITMEATMSECLERADSDNRPEGTKEAITEWYTSEQSKVKSGMCCTDGKVCEPCGSDSIKRLDVTFDAKSFHIDADDERKFAGYANTFDHLDRAGDITMRGAFLKSLSKHLEKGTKVKMLAHHDTTRPIGVWEKMVEDEKGLYVEGRLTKGVRDADEAYELLKDGALDAMSIGYRVVREEYDRKSGANLLHEVDLHEISLVAIPANQESVITAVKSGYDVRSLEKSLRDAGLSRREAKALLAKGVSGLESERDASAHDSKQQAKTDTQNELKRMLKILG